MQTGETPRLIATVGLHGSASTWVFNVVRELLINASGQAAVLAIHANGLDEMPGAAERAGRHLLVKSHQGSPELDDWLTAGHARIILSVRDPRDAALSMVQRFRKPLDGTVRWLVNDCERVVRLAALGHAVLTYEKRFFDDPNTVTELAAWLGLHVPPATTASIFERYRTEQVKAFAQALSALPAERLTMVGTTMMDRVTRILGPHIGDGRVGKWRDLPQSAQQEITRPFAPFLDWFSYPR